MPKKNNTKIQNLIKKKKKKGGEFDFANSAEETLSLLQRNQAPKRSKCGMVRDWVNNGSAVMILVTMVLLALLLIVYYFRSGSSYSTPSSDGSRVGGGSNERKLR
jgi:hypothetical protein